MAKHQKGSEPQGEWSIETLMPYVTGKGVPTITKQLDQHRRTVAHIVRAIGEQYYGQDFLMHLYMAGVWHGAETQRRLIATGELASQQPKLL